MTRDDIIRLAREAGWNGIYSKPLMTIAMQEENFLRFAAFVAAAEREACAEMCERRKSLYWMEFDKTGSDADRAAAIASEECSDAIRARGESK
jgi:hypothetical protein